MSSHKNPDTAEKINVSSPDCGVWHRLHSEREEACEALLNDARREKNRAGTCLNQSWSREAETTHREILQARLRQLDDALDRIVAGTYGECSSCGRWIEDNRLAADPSLSLCIDCQQRVEHHLLGMTGQEKFSIH
jgi:DnaK suppressor protein